MATALTKDGVPSSSSCAVKCAGCRPSEISCQRLRPGSPTHTRMDRRGLRDDQGAPGRRQAICAEHDVPGARGERERLLRLVWSRREPSGDRERGACRADRGDSRGKPLHVRNASDSGRASRSRRRALRSALGERRAQPDRSAHARGRPSRGEPTPWLHGDDQARWPRARAPDLLGRDFRASGPDLLWVSDITYVATWAGFVYLAIVLDAWSRKVVGWSIGQDLKTELVLEALNMALTQRKAFEVIHHSDHGCQYTSVAFGKRCEEMGVRPSMGSVGDAYDNAMAESSSPRWKRSCSRDAPPEQGRSEERAVLLYRGLVQPVAATFLDRLSRTERLRAASREGKFQWGFWPAQAPPRRALRELKTRRDITLQRLGFPQPETVQDRGKPSSRTMSPLPHVNRLAPSCCLSARIASARSPSSA